MRDLKTAVWSAVWIAASAHSPECGFAPPQILEPVSLTVLSGTVKSPCAVPAPECLLELVLELDQSYLRLGPDANKSATIALRFTTELSLVSAFSIRVKSANTGGWADAILVRNWMTGDLEVKTGSTVSSGDMITTTATVSCDEAAKYVSSSGEVEVEVLSVFGENGQSDKWVDKVEIEIPPPM